MRTLDLSRILIFSIAILTIVAICPSWAQDFDFTGVWSCDDGGTYYIKQIDNSIWWYGEQSTTTSGWTNVAQGIVVGKTIALSWADVPKGDSSGSGSLVLDVISDLELKVREEQGAFAGTTWNRQQSLSHGQQQSAGKVTHSSVPGTGGSMTHSSVPGTGGSMTHSPVPITGQPPNATQTPVSGNPTKIIQPQALITWDFEVGNLNGWTKTGNAFDYQPTYKDNPTARNREEPSNQQGNYWIGTYEKYPGPNSGLNPGDVQGDEQTGTLTSLPFVINGDTMSFLIGGGCDLNTVHADLLVDGIPVLTATGKCAETMERMEWDVSAYKGREAMLQVVDSGLGNWGHINFDDVRFDLPPTM